MRFIAIFLLSLITSQAQIRINERGFGMTPEELRVLAKTTIACFPPAADPPLYLSFHQRGPIALYERTPRGEVAIQLSCSNRYYSQFIYQFAHELAHVRAHFTPIQHENHWLEETLCEVASLYALGQISEAWAMNPPRSELARYHEKLRSYANEISQSLPKLKPRELASFYQKHRDELRKPKINRTLNRSIAITLLPLFEQNPSVWETLPFFPRTKGATLKAHLREWQKRSPQKHQKLFTQLADLFLEKASLPE